MTLAQRIAALTLAHCDTQIMAARRARVSTRTVRRWRELPAFQAAVEAEAARMMERFRRIELAEHLDRHGDYLEMYAAAARARSIAARARDSAGHMRRVRDAKRAARARAASDGRPTAAARALAEALRAVAAAGELGDALPMSETESPPPTRARARR